MGRDVRITSTMHAQVQGMRHEPEEPFDDVVDRLLRVAIDSFRARELSDQVLRQKMQDLYRDLIFSLGKMPVGADATSVFARRNLLFSRVAVEMGEIISTFDIYATRYMEPVFDVKAASSVMQEPGADMTDLVESVRHLTEAVEAGISVSIDKE